MNETEGYYFQSVSYLNSPNWCSKVLATFAKYLREPSKQFLHCRIQHVNYWTAGLDLPRLVSVDWQRRIPHREIVTSNRTTTILKHAMQFHLPVSLPLYQVHHFLIHIITCPLFLHARSRHETKQVGVVLAEEEQEAPLPGTVPHPTQDHERATL